MADWQSDLSGQYIGMLHRVRPVRRTKNHEKPETDGIEIHFNCLQFRSSLGQHVAVSRGNCYISRFIFFSFIFPQSIACP